MITFDWFMLSLVQKQTSFFMADNIMENDIREL
jgi:hypothetical protein